MFIVELTCYIFFINPFENLYIEDGAKHAFQDSNLWANSQREKHHEEYDGPEWCPRKLDYSLSEYDEG